MSPRALRRVLYSTRGSALRVALVNNIYVDQLGYYYISAVLKAAGHDVRYFTATSRLNRELRAFAPQLIGMTAVTGTHGWTAFAAAELKRNFPKVPVVVGGPHPTFHPQFVRREGIDYICRGEGEGPIQALCSALERGADTTAIAGIWAKTGDHIAENPFAPLIDDLDRIPFPDRSIYRRLRFGGGHLYPFLISSRGCPWKCTFCFEPTLFELTRGKGRFVRFRSVANVIAEALTLRSEWSARGVEFVDDIFGMHRPWLREFADRWRKEVALPFHCNLRADLLDDEMVELLARAGCRSVAFGVEAGSARVRNEVLVKDVSDQDLRDAAMRLRRARIRVITYNILGSPGETWDETWRTLTLNQELRPDYASVSLMQPYPSSKIYDIAVQHGLFPEGDVDRIAPTFHESTPLAIDHRREVANLQKLFNVALLWPRLTPLVQRLIRWPENRLFEAVFLLLHFGVFWIGVKRIPLRYLGAVAFNIGEIVRRHRSGLYRRRLPSRDAAPSLTEMIEKAAV